MRRMLLIGCVVLAPGCVVREYRESPPPPVVYRSPPPPPPRPVVEPDPEVASVEIEPPYEQPAAVAIPYAPPPMLWDPPPAQPWADAVWVGGHWTWWNGEWVWARGHWARPVVGWTYCEPYYEHRGDNVIFVAGFWRPVNRVFVPPPPTMYVPVVQVRVVHVGYARPVGPHGVFVPAPPGSQPGVIVPAPVGTPPAVVLSAPPVVRPGMVVRPAPRPGVVEVVAPAGVTREGHPVTAQAPVVSNAAASVHPVVVVAPPARSVGGPVHAVGQPAPGPSAFPARPSPGPQPTVGGAPVGVPVSPQASTGTVSVRPLPSGPEAPPVRGAIRPEGTGQVNPPPAWATGDRAEGPIVRPVQRPEVAPRPMTAPGSVGPPPAPVAPPRAAPSTVSAPPVVGAPAGTPRAESPRPRPPAKVTPEERKGHPDPHER